MEIDRYFNVSLKVNEVKHWKEVVFNSEGWKQALKKNPNYHKTIKKMAFQDLFFVCKFVDQVEWWQTIGKKEYPIISNFALVFACIPDSNAFQEQNPRY